MQFHNTYAAWGYSSWEFPDLTNGKQPMVSDSDGKNFPFYGSHNEIALVHGPQLHATLHQVTMNDNFNPHVTWDLPILNSVNHHKIQPKLTHIKRDQRFYTWLVAMDVNTGTILVLRTFKWRINLEIEVDPRRELGVRARLVGNTKQMQPRACKSNVEIPNCALYPSNANSSQILVWRASNSSKPRVIVGSKSFRRR